MKLVEIRGGRARMGAAAEPMPADGKIHLVVEHEGESHELAIVALDVRDLPRAVLVAVAELEHKGRLARGRRLNVAVDRALAASNGATTIRAGVQPGKGKP